MAIIEGQIEPLKKIREKLEDNGITRFNSIAEINHFLNHYDEEKKNLQHVIKAEISNEINELQIKLQNHQHQYHEHTREISEKILAEIKKIKETLRQLETRCQKSLFYKIFFYFNKRYLVKRKTYLQKNTELIVKKETIFSEEKVSQTKEKLNGYKNSSERLIEERLLESRRQLELTKEVVDGLYSMIAGAIGENAVTKEIKKLPDDFHLFNNFSIRFDPPIYNKKDEDRIYSLQIDHLLVCRSGVFVLETKNWNKNSIKNFDLRSPVKQILRSGYAFAVLFEAAFFSRREGRCFSCFPSPLLAMGATSLTIYSIFPPAFSTAS